MELENISVNEFVSEYEFEPKNLEYVHDIGRVEDYGVSVRGKLRHDGESVSVLGAVVLDRQSGDPKSKDKKTAFTAYVGGLTNSEESVDIFTGGEAVEAMEKLYEKANGNRDMYSAFEDVDIDPVAMPTEDDI